VSRSTRSVRRVPHRKLQRLRKAEGLHARARQLTLQGKYARAADAFERAISLTNSRSLSCRPILAAILNDFGVLSKYAGRFARAKGLYERARRLMPPEDPQFKQFRATLYHNLAGLEHARGQHTQALFYARRGIRLRRKLRGNDRSPVVADQAALAAILVELGNLREAEAIHLRVLRVYRRRFGPRHFETASLLSNLGALYVKAGRFDAAERTLRRAARVLENVLGKNHPRLASVLNNLATLCARRGKFSEADMLYDRVLRLLGCQLRPTYPSIALVRANLRKNPAT
jgi:tetratricopeptide (TPR) repeat protein